MEADVKALIAECDWEKVFPQFDDAWAARRQNAKALRDAICMETRDSPSVAIAVSDPIAFASVFLTLCRDDAELALLSPNWTRREMDDAMEQVQPDWLVKEASDGELEWLRCSSLPKTNEKTGFRVLIPTGGTTGRIRFAIHDWRTLSSAVGGLQTHIHCERISSHCLLPLYHVSGFMQLMRSLLTSGSLVFGSLDSFRDTHGFLESVPLEERFLSLVPTQLKRLLHEAGNRQTLMQYQAIFLGGGPASSNLLRKARELSLPIALTYGMTETAAQVATLSPEEFLSGHTDQGRALPHVTIEIVSHEDGTTRMPNGEAGRIVLEGKSVFCGYKGQARLADKRFVTSDIGKIDTSGRLRVLWRDDRVIISGGEKIDLDEVERVALESGYVFDAAAFSVPDDEWGELLALAYSPSSEVESAEAGLREFMKESLSRFKIPKIWKSIETIPRSETGKPKLGELRGRVSK